MRPILTIAKPRSDHTIYVTAEPGGYAVEVHPEVAELRKVYASHADAFGYAKGLRRVRRWSIVDLTAGHVEAMLGIGGAQ